MWFSLFHLFIVDFTTLHWTFHFLVVVIHWLVFLEIGIVLALFQDELSELGSVQFFLFKLQIHWLADDILLLKITHVCKEWMFETSLKFHSIVGIEDKNLF